MAVIRPFRGLRYSLAKVGDLSAVTAPPYDVISAEEEEALRAKHPNNIIRLILGAPREGSPRPEAAYAEAADCLKAWTETGVLMRDEEPSLYVCDQEFTSSGVRKVRRGLIARVLIEDLDKGSIYAHEHTIPGPKADRLKLTRACRANLSQVFGLYPTGKDDVAPILDEATRRGPDGEAVDRDGTNSRFWRIASPAVIERLASAMAAKPLFIADGHHRYETALRYRDTDGGGPHGGKAATDYVLMCCVAMDDPGIVIWPTHRLLKGMEIGEADLLAGLAENFDVQPHPGSMADLVREMASLSDRHATGLLLKGGRRYRLALKSEAMLDRAMPGRSREWRRLDVSILHSLVLDRLLGLDLDRVVKHENVGYVKSVEEAEAKVEAGEYQFAFLLNPTRVEQVRTIAGHREKMPPKSTYFFPKLLSGLVINPLSD